MALTAADIRAILDKAGLRATTEEQRVFLEYIQEAVGGLSPDLADEIYEQFRGALTSDADPATVARARETAEKIASELIENLAKAEISSVVSKIEQGVLDGKNPIEVARSLTEITGLDANSEASLRKYEAFLRATDSYSEERVERRRQELIRKRRQTIARTEQRRITSEKNKLEAEARGQKYKRWSTTGDDRVSEDICLPNEKQGWIGVDEKFQSGDMHPPGHPNCRCTVIYRTNEPDKRAQDRAKAKAEATEAAVLGQEVAA